MFYLYLLQRMQSNFGETAMGIRRIEDAFREWRSHGCGHIQFNDFDAARSGHSTVGIHWILRQQSESHLTAEPSTDMELRISDFFAANRSAGFEDWLPDGRYTTGAVHDDTISLQFDCLLCTQSSGRRSGFLWWSLKLSTYGNYDSNVSTHTSKFVHFNSDVNIYVPFSDVSKWCVVLIFQRATRIHERQFGRCPALVQKIVEVAKPLAAIPSSLLLGNSVGQLFETELEGGRDLCDTTVWKQQMVSNHLHIPKGCGDAHAQRFDRCWTANDRNVDARSTAIQATNRRQIAADGKIHHQKNRTIFFRKEISGAARYWAYVSVERIQNTRQEFPARGQCVPSDRKCTERLGCAFGQIEIRRRQSCSHSIAQRRMSASDEESVAIVEVSAINWTGDLFCGNRDWMMLCFFLLSPDAFKPF